MQYREFEPMNYYQVDGDGFDDFASQLNSFEHLIPPSSPSEFAGVQGTGGFPYGVSDTPGLHGLPEAQRIALNDAENQARIAQKAAIRQKMDEVGATMFVSGMGYAPEGEFGGFTGAPVVAPVAPPVAPLSAISQPDDFEMLRRMQEFREIVPTALVPEISQAFNPRIIEDDFDMIRRLQEFRETAPVAPDAPPAGLPQLISQDEGLRPRMPESEIAPAAPLSEARISDDTGLIPRAAGGLPALPAAQQTSAIDKMTQQILGQGTTSKWTGTGFGSAEANARGMAEQLAKYGLTDISQFGTKIVDVPESRIFVDDEFGGSEQVTPASQRRIYYNKATGQEIMPDYARAGDNIWSGTYAGQGSTGFGVDFDEEGNPYFYTQYGGSTSDWTNTVRPALQLLANTVGMFTPMAPYIAAANALNAAKKGDWKTAILSALPAAGQIAGSLGASAQTVSALQTANQAARVLNALDKGDLLGAALGGANLAGISNIAGIDLKDVNRAVNIARAIESGNPLAIMQVGKALAGGTGTAEKELPDQGTGGDLGYYPGQGEEDSGDDYQDELLRQIGIDPKTTGEVATPTNQEILEAIGYTPVQSEPDLTPEEVQRILTQPVNEDIQPYKDEMDRYAERLMRTQTDELDNVIEPTPPEYGVQDIPITPENFQSFDENLVKMLEESRLPSQFVENDDGTYTLTSDDGSAITIDKDGNVSDVLAAPEDTDFHQVIVGQRPEKIEPTVFPDSLIPQEEEEPSFNMTIVDKKFPFADLEEEYRAYGPIESDVKDDVAYPTVTVTSSRDPCPPGTHVDEEGECVADPEPEDPTQCPEGYLYNFNTQSCEKISDTPPSTPRPPPPPPPPRRPTGGGLSMAGGSQTNVNIPPVQQLAPLVLQALRTEGGGGGYQDPLARLKEIVSGMRPTSAPTYKMDPYLESLVNQSGRDSYFTYGKEPSMEDVLGMNRGFAGGGEVESFSRLASPLMAAGGRYMSGREDFRDGKHVSGPGDGQSDDIPAWLADGEFVFPADVVAALGNGSTKAGTDKLYDMMHNIRKYHRSADPEDLPPEAKKSPLDYLSMGKKGAKA